MEFINNDSETAYLHPEIIETPSTWETPSELQTSLGNSLKVISDPSQPVIPNLEDDIVFKHYYVVMDTELVKELDLYTGAYPRPGVTKPSEKD